MPSRQRSSEADGPRNGRIRDAGGGNVRLQIPDGAGAEYPPAGRIHHCLHRRLPQEGALPHLRLCLPKWHLQRLCQLVDPLPVPMGCPLGSRDAAAEEHAP
jgi:hypothetical protein